MNKEKDDEIKKKMAETKKDKKQLDPNFKMLSGKSTFVFNPDETDEEETDQGEDDLQELIRNRKRIEGNDSDEDDEEEDMIMDVELPSDEEDADQLDKMD